MDTNQQLETELCRNLENAMVGQMVIQWTGPREKRRGQAVKIVQVWKNGVIAVYSAALGKVNYNLDGYPRGSGSSRITAFSPTETLETLAERNRNLDLSVLAEEGRRKDAQQQRFNAILNLNPDLDDNYVIALSPRVVRMMKFVAASGMKYTLFFTIHQSDSATEPCMVKGWLVADDYSMEVDAIGDTFKTALLKIIDRLS